ncbi:hypothetical protein [Krasilnikovia sp. MM14-A1004]|uniref:hypothetical protein n=1 Tax=Krasilnikovia sp. MM14-A1004 TaxID=3373541 RepID=UPI00399D2F7D
MWTSPHRSRLCREFAVATLAAAAVLVPATAAHAAAGRYRVDSTADAPDADPGDGRCASAADACTVRAATMEANADPGSTIVIPAGHYRLTIPPLLGKAFTDYTLADAAHGNLKLFKPTRVEGAGRDATVIDGGHLDRVFTTLGPVTIVDLTITGGDSEPVASLYNYYGGGAVLNASDLTMERVHLTGNSARFGGAVQNIPFAPMTLRDSLVDHNEAGEAGGLRFDWTGRVENSVITDNRVTDPHDPTRPAELAGYGGGIDVRGPATVTVVASTVSRNHADKGGGGINITLGYVPGPPGTPGPGKVELQHTTVTDNTSNHGPSDCRAVWARIVDLGNTVDSDGSCVAGD